MKKIRKISMLVMFIFSVVFLQAVNDNIGTTGFSFFRTDISARANAMAGAYSALSNDVNAVFYNPAGLSLIDQTQISTTFSSYLMGIPIGTIAYTTNYNSRRIAIFAQYLTDEQDRMDDNGIQNGTFNNSDLMLGFSYAKQVHPVVYLGFSAKYLMETLDNTSATAMVFDFGVIHQTTNKNLKVGLTFKNFGFQLTYFSDDKIKEKLPKTVVAALNYFPTDKLNILFDLEKQFYGGVIGKIGTEFKYNKILVLRAGYNTDASDWNNGGTASFLAGVSLGFGLNWKKYSFDYAIKSFGDLGFNNQISLKYSF